METGGNKKMNELKVKKLDPMAKLPTYGSSDAAGMDLYALKGSEIDAGETVMIHTGIAMAIPKGYVGLIYARSGLACKNDLAPANKVGVIDADYRGEIIVALHNHGKLNRVVMNGDRIAQMVITPYVTCTPYEVEELDDTERGDGGFGSTGQN